MKRLFAIGIILLFAFIVAADLIHPGFPVTHDGQDHVARIANFYQNLADGVFIPRWAGNLNWGYGHPILEFLYPLPSYLSSLFHFLGFTFVDSVKLVFALGVIASGIAMYFFLESMWGAEAGLTGGILYMYTPYRFIDLYVRGDIGEHIAFIFIPLVCWGLYLLYKTEKNRYILYSSAAFALLILAHNAISLMMLPVLLALSVYLWWQKSWSRKFLFQLILSFSVGFLLSSFFWVPALLEGQFTLRNIVTKGQYGTRFVSFNQLVYGPWSYDGSGYFTVQIGIVNWIFLLISFSWIAMHFWKKNQSKNQEQRKELIFISGLFLFTVFAVFLMLSVSSFLWKQIMLLQNFQFPWRFLAIPVFTTSVIGGYFVSKIPQTKRIIATIAILIILLFLSKDYIHAKSYNIKPEAFFTGIYKSSTDTGESAPIWSIRFMEHGFNMPLVSVKGVAQVTQEIRRTTVHQYVVSVSNTTRFVENTLYFPGWKVLVDGKNVPVQFQDPQYRGLMTFYVPTGTHTVDVVYQESKLRVFGDILSLIGIIPFIGIWIFSLRKKYL